MKTDSRGVWGSQRVSNNLNKWRISRASYNGTVTPYNSAQTPSLSCPEQPLIFSLKRSQYRRYPCLSSTMKGSLREGQGRGLALPELRSIRLRKIVCGVLGKVSKQGSAWNHSLLFVSL